MRRIPPSRVASFSLTALLLAAAPLQPAGAAAGPGPGQAGRFLPPEMAAGSYLVRLEPGTDRAAFRAALLALGGRVHHEYALTPQRLNVRQVSPAAAAALRRLPGVAGVAPDAVVHGLLAESVPLVGALFTDFDMRNTDGGLGIPVCMLDTGINRFHVMFDDDNNPETPTNKIRAWKDWINGETVPFDNNGHGSHIAGAIWGRLGLTLNGKPFQGLAPKATIYVGKVLNSSAAGLASDVQAGIEWCAGMAPDSPVPPARVINLSLGFGAFTQVCDATDPTGLAATANAAAAAGVLVVAAAGNEANRNAVVSPACASGVMSVSSIHDADVGPFNYGLCVDHFSAADVPPCFSNRWAGLEVVAPGCLIDSASTLSTLVVANCGSSQAAAHVSGLAALVLGANRTFTGPQVRQRITGTALDLGKPGPDRAHGHGRILAGAAVNGCFAWETPETSCSNGFDDDCDDLPDCADPDCCADVACASGDGDGDGFAGCDCDGANAQAWRPAGPVGPLALSHDAGTGVTSLAWTPPASPGGAVVTYDVLRTPSPGNFFTAASCMVTAGTGTVAGDSDLPAGPGQILYYAVRPASGCPGPPRGHMGADSDGVHRAGRSCP